MAGQEVTGASTHDPIVHLELPVDAPLAAVIDAESSFLGVIVEVGQEIIERRAGVGWLLTHASTNGAIRLRLRAVPAHHRVQQARLADVATAVVSGIAELEQAAVRPPHFNDAALVAVQRLGNVSARLGVVRVVNGSHATSVTPEASEHVHQVLGASYSAYGSVEGRLEGVSLHDGQTFWIYDPLDGRRINCRFGDGISLSQVADALVHRARVIVYGTIKYRQDDAIAFVDADELLVIPRDSELPTADDVRGILG